MADADLEEAIFNVQSPWRQFYICYMDYKYRLDFEIIVAENNKINATQIEIIVKMDV